MVFSVFSVASLYLMRENILTNSNQVGNEVAQRLDASLQVEFEKQKQFVELIAHYADVFLQEHRSDPDGGRAAFDLWLRQTEETLRDKQTELQMDIYASIDGQFVSPVYWDGNAFLITEARPWYKAAMASPQGKAVILDPYTDILTNTVITTISARIGDSNDVFACDIYLETASQSSMFASLVPENYCFYLVDQNGKVILYYTPFNANYTQIQHYIDSFFNTHIKDNDSVNLNSAPITDLIGEKCNIFAAYNPKTGWYTIATTLYSEILFNYHMISNLFLLMVVIFIIVEVWMVWREYHLSSQIETTNEALKVLGNSYQIIMRVNFKQRTFTTLKAPDMMRLRLASRNNFDDLMAVFSDVVLPDSWNNFYKNFSLSHIQNLASLSIRDFGHDYQLKLSNDNHFRWYNARILFDESLDLDESILCFKLIDEEKITELEEHKLLADALESAKKNEESKNVFFANMSHDMRTPLNGIIGLCQIGINNINNTNHLQDVFKKLTTASQQLLTLVDDILEVARPQMENKLNNAPFNIVNATRENIDVFKVNAQQQGKSVSVSFDVQHEQVIGDAAKLRQILNNLVSNSLKYSLPGCQVSVHIREILHLHKPSFIIEVADTGIGMDKEYLKKLFTPYSREQRLPSVQGTGLGMSIVKNVVNIMGGDIKVKSTLNVGTTFTINIPFRLYQGDTNNIANSTEEAAINKHSQQSLERSLSSSTISDRNNVSNISKDTQDFIKHFTLEGLNLMIVEDNQLNMEIACDILGMKGAHLTSAWDGEQAVEIFNSNPPYSFDAILMDMRMPKMGGCDATIAIRASSHPDAQTVPIIACTANAFTEDIAATQNAGMNAHVSKPLDFKILESLLAKLIASRPDRDKLSSQFNKTEQSTQSNIAPAASVASTAPTNPAAMEALPENPAEQKEVVASATLAAQITPESSVASSASGMPMDLAVSDTSMDSTIPAASIDSTAPVDSTIPAAPNIPLGVNIPASVHNEGISQVQNPQQTLSAVTEQVSSETQVSELADK